MTAKPKKPRRRPAPRALGKKRVFVLGAGFSYAAGFPLAAHLLSEVYARISPESRKQLLDVIKYLYPLGHVEDPKNLLRKVWVEDLMSMLDMSEQFNERVPTTYLTSPRIRELNTEILRGITELLIARQDAAEAKASKVAYVDGFVSKLETTDTVVTFNWDLLLERRLPIPFRYGAPQSRSELAVLKLHGSINWFHGEDLLDRRAAEQIHLQLFKVPYQSLRDGTVLARTGAAPFLVPPTYFKDVRGTSDLEGIWASAFECLVEADEIHFCGYRLPREDMYARLMLRRAVRENVGRRIKRRIPPLRVTVVNPCKAVAKEMRAILFKDIKGVPDAFENSSWATRLPRTT